jgi:O-antigen/teichoic acid export membrane protein
MNIKKVILNSIWFGVVPKLNVLINLLIMPIITPFLTPADYGVWGVVHSYAQLGMAFSALGLNMHLTNSYYEYKGKFNLVWGRIFFLLLCSTGIISLILTFVIYFSLGTLAPFRRLAVAILGVFPVLLQANVTLAEHLYPVRGEPKPLVLGKMFSSLVGLGVLFVLVYYLREGYMGFVVSAAVSAVLAFFIFQKLVVTREHINVIPELKGRRIKVWFGQSLPVIPHQIGFVLFSSMTRVIMTWFPLYITMDQIGLFSNAQIMGGYIAIIASAMLNALVPVIQESYRRGDRTEFRSVYFLVQSMVFCGVFMFSVWMPEIYKLLVRNKAFGECVFLAQWMEFSNIVYPFYGMLATQTFIDKRTLQLLWLVFIPGIINGLCCLVCFPFFSYRCSVYIYMAAHLAQMVLPLFIPYYREKIRFLMGERYALRTLLLAAVFLGALFLSIRMSFLSLPWKGGLTVVFSAAGVWVMRRCSNLKKASTSGRSIQ